MLRKTLTILSLIGLLLSVGLWGVSYLHPNHQADKHTLGARRGCVFLTNNAPKLAAWYFVGFETHWLPDYNSGLWTRSYYLSIPLWIPSVAFIMLGMGCVVPPACRRRKRRKLGLCLKCGYDLRGSKERCPECGTVFEN